MVTKLFINFIIKNRITNYLRACRQDVCWSTYGEATVVRYDPKCEINHFFAL